MVATFCQIVIPTPTKADVPQEVSFFRRAHFTGLTSIWLLRKSGSTSLGCSSCSIKNLKLMRHLLFEVVIDECLLSLRWPLDNRWSN